VMNCQTRAHRLQRGRAAGLSRSPRPPARAARARRC